MRHFLLVLVPAGVGCAEACPTAPESLNQSLWHVFNKHVELATPPLAGGYPGESSPGNVWHDMIITWASNSDGSPVTVNMDGQVFQGRGTWDSEDCGNFHLSFNGDYLGDDGTKHAFIASGPMQTWDGHLEGIWEMREVWTGLQGEKDEDVWTIQVIGTL